MTVGRKLILDVGEFNNIKLFKDYLRIVREDRIVFGKRVGNVTDAMKEINSGNYWGVLMSSLVLSPGSKYRKYSREAKKFEGFDYPPNIWRSGGFYVVEQACNKGLITVVNAIAEGNEEIAEAKRLGARCFNGFNNMAARNIEYFQNSL